MSLDLDTSRSIRTPAGRRDLICAVRDSQPGEFELDWLEWKSDVDLRQKKWKFEIARQTLGFGNRDAARAARVAEGCAYLLMGVEATSAAWNRSTRPSLQAGVATYLGPHGPQWNPDLEEVEGATVLVVTVEPPRLGDPIFTLEKEFDGGYRNGDIFVRRPGKTEKASAADIRNLTARAMAKERRQVSIDVLPAGNSVPSIRAIELGDEAARWWVNPEHEGWIHTYQRKRAALGAGRGYSIINPMFPSPESFKEDLQEYLANGLQDYGLRARLRAQEVGVGLLERSMTGHVTY